MTSADVIAGVDPGNDALRLTKSGRPSRFMPVSIWIAAPPAQPERRQNTSHSASLLRSPITGLADLAKASPLFWKKPSRT